MTTPTGTPVSSGAGRRVEGVRGLGRVADAQATQVGFHRAVGVGDHAHRQAERGHGPQAVYRPGADVGPAVAPDPVVDLDGERLALVLGHPAGGDIGEQVLPPPGVLSGRQGGRVLDRHRLVVSPLEGGEIGVKPAAQRRQYPVRFREDQDPARVEQDRADPGRRAERGRSEGPGAHAEGDLSGLGQAGRQPSGPAGAAAPRRPGSAPTSTSRRATATCPPRGSSTTTTTSSARGSATSRRIPRCGISTGSSTRWSRSARRSG
jgi:hypothetical protein